MGGTVALLDAASPLAWANPFLTNSKPPRYALWSLPAVKSMEIGSGLHGTTMRGSAHNTPKRTSKVKCARRPITGRHPRRHHQRRRPRCSRRFRRLDTDEATGIGECGW